MTYSTALTPLSTGESSWLSVNKSCIFSIDARISSSVIAMLIADFKSSFV